MQSSIKQTALRTIQMEAQSIEGLSSFINDDFEKAIGAIANCKGRVVVSGIGKSAVIAQKIVATLNSTGTPSILCMLPTLYTVTWEWCSRKTF